MDLQPSYYRKLLVWQRSMDFVTQLYDSTKNFPSYELYGLTSQMRRAAVSIPSNIAEGSRKGSQKEFKRFLSIAFGSGAELETQLDIALNLNYLEVKIYKNLIKEISEIQKMINSLISKIKSN
jgi:four helix bundle protein